MQEKYQKKVMRWLLMSELRFNPTSPVIVLDVEIEGVTEKTTKSMALDTGATYMIIPWDVAELLGYTPEITKEKITMVTASGVELAPVITLKSVSALGKKSNSVKAIVHDLPPKSYVDGLLELSFLRNFNWSLNFREGVIGVD